jgi:hypothetical protein
MRRLHYVILILFITFFNSCKKGNNELIDNNDQYNLIEGEDFVILHNPLIKDNWFNIDFIWGISAKLGQKELINLNKILNKAIEKYNENEILENQINLTEYKRQYIAIYNWKGEKEVYVYCFNKYILEYKNKENLKNEHWKNNIFYGIDGGKNKFN